jgi:site-specific recombinase
VIDDIIDRIGKANAEYVYALGQNANAAPREVSLFCELIAAIRPARIDDNDYASMQIRSLILVLQHDSEKKRALRDYFVQVISSRKLLHLLTDSGIPLRKGVWAAAWHRLVSKILPPLTNDEYVKDIFRQVFCHSQDYLWVTGVADDLWNELIVVLGFRISNPRAVYAALTRETLSAIQVLSYRITAIGFESELVRNYPAIERFESPFLRQNDAINEYIESYTAWLLDKKCVREDGLHIDVLLTQCEEVLVKIRRTAAKQGVSVSLTRMLLRLTQSIARLRCLLDLLDARPIADVVPLGVSLFKELVEADNRRYNLGDLIKSNTELLSLQMTERAGLSGEHYVSNNRGEWLAMMRSAMGGGWIVGFMAMLKILMSKLALAPFGFAFLYSLNYSIGFIAIHVLHFTVATKQPAMTAAVIAGAIDEGPNKLEELVELIVRVLRSQFIAIVGNLALAMPTAYAIAWTWYGISGSHLVNPEKIDHLLHDIDPFASLALPHAAVAGVCLFLSGLVSGYYDNKSSYANIPARLRQLKWLKELLGEARLLKVTTYIGNNLGALAGNFFFGVALGSIGQFGEFFGLPIDIRHIAFSSANFAFSLVGLDHQMSWQLATTSLVGILLIGLVNLAVSFSLALFVALRSRRLNFGQGRRLSVLLWHRFVSGPSDFFFPPKEDKSNPELLTK